MEYIIHKLSLNMHSSVSQTSLYVKTGDTHRKLRITLTDNGKVYRISDGCVAAFSANKDNGDTLYNACTIEDNAIVYEFTELTANVSGKMDCEIKLYDADNELITSPQFSIIVDDVVCNDKSVVASSEFSALTQLLTEINEARQELYEKIDDLHSLLDGAAKLSSVTLRVADWKQLAANRYYQEVEIDGVTENSRVDIHPSAIQLAVFHEQDIAFVTENEDGKVTVYCIGQKPTSDYTMQVTITEVIPNE